jgi:hypothetical protein
MAGAFIGIALLGVTPIPYAARAGAAVIISASAWGLVSWMYLSNTGSPLELAESMSIMVLASALFFRAWHRSSQLARLLVVLGVVGCVIWLSASGALTELVALEPAWQLWLPAVLRAPLALLLMFSLLAFVDARSTGGCGTWAAGILLWLGLQNGVRLLIGYWPPELSVPDWSRVPGDVAMTLVAGPLLAAIASFGTAQLLAVARANGAAPRRPASEQ